MAYFSVELRLKTFICLLIYLNYRSTKSCDILHHPVNNGSCSIGAILRDCGPESDSKRVSCPCDSSLQTHAALDQLPFPQPSTG